MTVTQVCYIQGYWKAHQSRTSVAPSHNGTMERYQMVVISYFLKDCYSRVSLSFASSLTLDSMVNPCLGWKSTIHNAESSDDSVKFSSTWRTVSPLLTPSRIKFILSALFLAYMIFLIVPANIVNEQFWTSKGNQRIFILQWIVILLAFLLWLIFVVWKKYRVIKCLSYLFKLWYHF